MKLPFLSCSPETKDSLPCLVLREQVASLSGSPAHAHLNSDVCLLRVQPSDCKQLALPVCQPLYGRPLGPLPSQSFVQIQLMSATKVRHHSNFFVLIPVFPGWIQEMPTLLSYTVERNPEMN